jgi:hypothetical protein
MINVITTITKMMGVITVGMLLSAQVCATQISCQDILKHHSRHWIDAYCSEPAHQHCNTMDVTNALSIYRTCYHKRTFLLKRKLDLNGAGPSMAAMENFNHFSKQLNAFTALALKATSGGGTYDAIQASYAYLYQKQFAYLFYQSYIKAGSNHGAKHTRSLAQLNRAKHYLDRCMQRFPEVSTSFSQVMASHKDVPSIPRLSIYLYAIGMLQSVADPEFSPPPF